MADWIDDFYPRLQQERTLDETLAEADRLILHYAQEDPQSRESLLLALDNETARMKRMIGATDTEIIDGMLKWAPGTLPSTVIDRIVLDALADMWTDSYRGGEQVDRARIVRFHDRLAKLVTAATGYGDII